MSKLFVSCVEKIQMTYTGAIETAEKNLNKSILSFQERLNELLKIRDLKLPTIVAATEANDYYMKLDDAKILDLVVDPWKAYYTLDASIEDLRILRNEFGVFELLDDQKEISDPDKGLVSIPVAFIDHKFVCFRVRVVRPIPADAKCKIVKTTRVVENTSLVCDMDQELNNE